MSFLIREARAEDAQNMIQYLKQVGGETDNLTFGAEGLPATPEIEAKIITHIHDDPHCVMYIAEKDGKIIGDGTLDGMPRRMQHRAELGISVIREEWNSGVGSALMEALITYAKDNGIEIIHLDVREDNAPAIHLYEKFGFHRIGVIPAYFKIGDQYIDFLTMYLDLRG